MEHRKNGFPRFWGLNFQTKTAAFSPSILFFSFKKPATATTPTETTPTASRWATIQYVGYGGLEDPELRQKFTLCKAVRLAKCGPPNPRLCTSAAILLPWMAKNLPGGAKIGP